MTRHRTLTNEEWFRIVTMRQRGLKCKHIAKVLQMPRSTISTVLTKWRLISCMTTQPKSHVPQKLNSRALRNLAHFYFHIYMYIFSIIIKLSFLWFQCNFRFRIWVISPPPTPPQTSLSLCWKFQDEKIRIHLVPDCTKFQLFLALMLSSTTQ